MDERTAAAIASAASQQQARGQLRAMAALQCHRELLRSALDGIALERGSMPLDARQLAENAVLLADELVKRLVGATARPQ